MVGIISGHRDDGSSSGVVSRIYASRRLEKAGVVVYVCHVQGDVSFRGQGRASSVSGHHSDVVARNQFSV